RRVQLETEPDEVLPILSRLSQTPLGTEIRRDLSRLVFIDQPLPTDATGEARIPLRTRPFTKKGIAYLKELSPQIVISSPLPERIVLSWKRVQFVIARVWRYLWLLESRWWEKARALLGRNLEPITVPAPDSGSQPKIQADPIELVVKRIFLGQTRTYRVTF